MTYEKFIIGSETSGKVIEYSCDGSRLANYFGANPDAPHFLTSVFFEREVLDKYYNRPSEYSVNDGYVCRGIHWNIPIDNDQIDFVSVYLGYLGQLPYKEQQHWKIYNVSKGKVSKTSFRRNILAEFTSPTEPALKFKEKLILFNKKWGEKFCWLLFKPLHKGDMHLLKTIRVPNEEQKEFDDLVSSINKITIDSLNVSEMKKSISFDKNDKSISILEKYLIQNHNLKPSTMVGFLRDLQELRSKGSAHRKGSDYEKIYQKFNKGSLSETFEDILVKLTQTLENIENEVLNK